MPEVCRDRSTHSFSRNSTNIGGANNENLTFKLSRGKYFRWAAHDDVLAPKLLEECVAVLESHPEVVLCFSTTLINDENGNQTGEVKRIKGTQQDPYTRFVSLANTRDALEETYGLIRSDVLKKTRLQQNYTDSDRTLLSEIALLVYSTILIRRYFINACIKRMFISIGAQEWLGSTRNTKGKLCSLTGYNGLIIFQPQKGLNCLLRSKLSVMGILLDHGYFLMRRIL